MKRYGAKGTITVFFSLISILFLSLICTSIESARVQGARAQTANITDMGNYSVFSEYEKQLLEDYEIFAVDAAYGTGDFDIGRINDRLKGFLGKNAKVSDQGLSGLCFDPWKLQMDGSQITEYALLTDQGGEAFYQQAVAYMKETAATGVISRLYEYYQDAKKAEQRQEEYEENKNHSDQEMRSLEQQEEQIRQQQMQQSGTTDVVIVENNPVEEVRRENPLDMINKLRKKGILEIVCGTASVSEKKVTKKDLASKRSGQKGTLELKRKHSGLTSDLLFREYLLDHFPDYLSEESSGKLDYQIEYMIAGKKTDEANLKSVARRLLLLREGLNYFYCAGNPEMSAEAGKLAALLIGWTGVPALVSILKHALLLGWAYGESLMDVRTLLDGGRIPLIKSENTWAVTLEKLGQLNELLEQGGSERQEGLAYKDYLRILLNLQSISVQKKRGLDMVEINLQTAAGLSNFRVDYCMVGMREKTEWTINPVFLRVPAAFLGISGNAFSVTVESGFAYDP
ncbi:MAG: DUF5702 domain-containing protein [Lachnospiraceae bacterium]|nr:DUF5702 domain-containing protein [Lachnospiraceae bacterium]